MFGELAICCQFGGGKIALCILRKQMKIDRSKWSLRKGLGIYWFDLIVLVFVLYSVASGIPEYREGDPPPNMMWPHLKVTGTFLWLVNLLVHKENNLRRGGTGFFGR